MGAELAEADSPDWLIAFAVDPIFDYRFNGGIEAILIENSENAFAEAIELARLVARGAVISQESRPSIEVRFSRHNSHPARHVHGTLLCDGAFVMRQNAPNAMILATSAQGF